MHGYLYPNKGLVFQSICLQGIFARRGYKRTRPLSNQKMLHFANSRFLLVARRCSFPGLRFRQSLLKLARISGGISLKPWQENSVAER
ncbi:hypothetical protein AB6A40_009388 [Gnathostoma spinigerum]|uniref:Uncharacterized protein n=1 Tax=Gnathostoma spinigerum TaxID=75299 RepID=A0ABD6ERU7_9BILA